MREIGTLVLIASLGGCSGDSFSEGTATGIRRLDAGADDAGRTFGVDGGTESGIPADSGRVDSGPADSGSLDASASGGAPGGSGGATGSGGLTGTGGVASGGAGEGGTSAGGASSGGAGAGGASSGGALGSGGTGTGGAPPICTLGATQCSGSTVQTCAADGWHLLQACSTPFQACHDDACCVAKFYPCIGQTCCAGTTCSYSQVYQNNVCQ